MRSAWWLVKKWFLLVLVVIFLLLVGAFLSLRAPALAPWQHEALNEEFEHQDYHRGYTLAQYRGLEDRLFAELDDYAVDLERSPQYSRFIRYVKQGRNTPESFSQNWNRTYEQVPKEIKGGVLLIHGLTDSPYSLRHIGEIFLKNGYYVLGLRLPGHGTVPAGLVDVSWKDWHAAVAMGARHVAERTEGKGPFYICGYSAGGALAVRYTADVLRDGEGRLPDRLILFSPAIGITSFARVSNWHKIFSWIPFFEKDKWLDIKPEIDPFKYMSFPKNASAQMWELSITTQKEIEHIRRQDRLGKFPPVLTFLSVVDATVRAADVVTRLYDKLPDNGSELVIFDINRSGYLEGLFAVDPEESLKALEKSTTHPYRLAVLTNRGKSPVVVAKTTTPGSTELEDIATGMQWPGAGVYSLSHLAIPFPPDDPLYGMGPHDPATGRIRFGSLSPRGERRVLHIRADDLLRIRYNPFFDYMAERVQEWIEADSTF